MGKRAVNKYVVKSTEGLVLGRFDSYKEAEEFCFGGSWAKSPVVNEVRIEKIFIIGVEDETPLVAEGDSNLTESGAV